MAPPHQITIAPAVTWEFEGPGGRVARCTVANIRDGCWEVRFIFGSHVDTIWFPTRRTAMRCAVGIEEMLLAQAWQKRAHTLF